MVPASGSCQEKAYLSLKSVQKSHSLLKNCICQSTLVGLHLLHINDSTSDVFALQYRNIGNTKVLAFLMGAVSHTNLGVWEFSRAIALPTVNDPVASESHCGRGQLYSPGAALSQPCRSWCKRCEPVSPCSRAVGCTRCSSGCSQQTG